jgi:single-stranded-DNA-specific exonuclease
MRNPPKRTPTKRTSPNRSSSGKLPPPTPSEAAFERAFAAFGAPSAPKKPLAPKKSTAPKAAAAKPIPSEKDAFVERVFASSEAYLRDRFSTIADAPSFYTKVAGVSFEGRQDVVAGLQAGRELELVRDPANPYDANAIAVRYGDLQIGFISRGIAVHLAPQMDAGARYRARIASLTGGPGARSGEERSRGVNIFVERDAGAALEERARDREMVRGTWDGDSGAIRKALIGNSLPHEAQHEVLARLDRGANTLAVLGTGRGKSFCFQFTAAVRAFRGDAKTLVIYPLRALANDQYEALMRRLDPLGLRIFRANGAIGAQEREELFEALREGTWDVILSTPEFLAFHRNAFVGKSVPSFVVVDEAHHVAESKHRPAYANLGAAIASLGKTQVLALTATAGDEAFARIVEDLRIEAWVIDPTVRRNLAVVDARGTKDKTAYLRELFAQPGKGIVYCNSRNEATKVAQALRKDLGSDVMFYHAGMPTPERQETERLFREGGLRVVVATSAFGEGIDLPDVRHVVLYHLNFDFGEFNQQAGRAGRDGADAQIHLLYGDGDRRINEYLIDLDAPTLPVLRELYRAMRAMARDGVLRGGNTDLAGLLDIDKMRDRTIAAALRIFSDSALVETGEDDEGRFVRFLPVEGKVDLERNERFAEGEAIRDHFKRFCELALTAGAQTLGNIINRPIYPDRVDLRR